MAKLERTYNVPLRKSFVNTPKYKRAKKATTALREFLVKHMKSEDVKIGQHLNQHIWRHGIKNPPHHVKVNVTKDEEGIVKAELEGFEYKDTIKPEEEESEEGLASKLTGALGGKKEEIEKAEKAIAATKEEKKEEVKDEKKEEPKAKPKTAKKSPAKKTKKESPKKTSKKTTKKSSKK